MEEPGEYTVGIRFNEKHIPGSPYKVYIQVKCFKLEIVIKGKLRCLNNVNNLSMSLSNRTPLLHPLQPSADDAERVRLSNVADNPVKPDAPQTMLLNMNGADGDVECRIVAPSGREDDCFITPLGHGEHSVRLVSSENSCYSDTGGDCKKCHCGRLSQYLIIFSVRRSFLGQKNLSR